jgi:hypothetical protein
MATAKTVVNKLNHLIMNTGYLIATKKVFSDYKKLAERTIEQLNDEELFHQPDAESNSIAVIIKHLWGNMRSRWTNFLTEDGEKTWRHRDTEFEMDWNDRTVLMEKWEEGWKYLFDALENLTENDLDKTVLIRNQPLTVYLAINRQIAHYASHVGQIIYVGKMIKQSNWKTLSTARGKSKELNEKLMGKKI